MGQFGMAIARALTKQGAEVMVIDKKDQIIEGMADEVALAVALDATDKKALVSQGIMEFDAVVVAIGEDFEQLLLCTTLLMDLGVKQIMARARGTNQRIILEKIGVKEILSPEDEVGINVAERLINPSIVSFLNLSEDYNVVEIETPLKVVGRSLADLDIRRRYQLNLITIKRERKIKHDSKDEEGVIDAKIIIGIPTGETVIEEKDTLVLFGKKQNVERFIEINQ